MADSNFFSKLISFGLSSVFGAILFALPIIFNQAMFPILVGLPLLTYFGYLESPEMELSSNQSRFLLGPIDALHTGATFLLFYEWRKLFNKVKFWSTCVKDTILYNRKLTKQPINKKTTQLL